MLSSILAGKFVNPVFCSDWAVEVLDVGQKVTAQSMQSVLTHYFVIHEASETLDFYQSFH